jgi:hypothetical protein
VQAARPCCVSLAVSGLVRCCLVSPCRYQACRGGQETPYSLRDSRSSPQRRCRSRKQAQPLSVLARRLAQPGDRRGVLAGRFQGDRRPAVPILIQRGVKLVLAGLGQLAGSRGCMRDLPVAVGRPPYGYRAPGRILDGDGSPPTWQHASRQVFCKQRDSGLRSAVKAHEHDWLAAVRCRRHVRRWQAHPLLVS